MSGHAKPPRVLIAGGGVAALEALLALRALAGELPHLTLLAPDPEFVVRASGVLEPFARGRARRISLRSVAEGQSAVLVADTLASVDAERRLASTAAGEELPYDALLVALGAVPQSPFPGALTFSGPQDRDVMAGVLAEAQAGKIASIAFVVPASATWPLPLYELALLTRAHLRDHGRDGVTLTVVTTEDRPLAVFGAGAAADLEARLAAQDIDLRPLSRAREHTGSRLSLEGGGHVTADRAISLPRLTGPALAGLPQDELGFIPADDHGRVPGAADVYAAGDCTAFPLKQGGIAAQQADAAAQSIAAALGADAIPRPFTPILRGLLLTGDEPSYFRAYPGAEREPTSVAIETPRRRRRASAPHDVAAHRPLWWPPSKVAGPYLGAWLVGGGAPGGAPPQIEDRDVTPPSDEAAAVEEREAALDLALTMADGEARYGDWKAALRALDAAQALAGALPPEYAQLRELWEAELSGASTARFRGS